jgi:TOBE domain
LIRPENVDLLIGRAAVAKRNSATGRVVDTVSYGGTTKSFVEMAGGTVLTTRELTRADREIPTLGTEVSLSWDAAVSLVLPLAGGIVSAPQPTSTLPVA